MNGIGVSKHTNTQCMRELKKKKNESLKLLIPHHKKSFLEWRKKSFIFISLSRFEAAAATFRNRIAFLSAGC